MPIEPAEPLLPKGFMRAALLLLLREKPAHGYELLDRLQPLGVGRSDPGGLYRALRALEHDGRVRSGWEPSGSGPHRRIYQITRAGMKELHATARSFSTTRTNLDAFLSRYQEFVALDVASTRDGAAGAAGPLPG